MNIELRKYPYPYQAMLAICSDLDETPNKEVYFETARYLNTTEDTSLGKGVGLEVGNTIYFDMPQGQFSYTNSDNDGRNKIHQLIESGHIDCLHSFGDFVYSRERIESCWQTISQGPRKIEVWVDHGQAPTNLDNDIMKGSGAIVGDAAFHADLTIGSGALPFIWKGRVTSIVAQNSPRSYVALFNVRQVVASGKTILLEFIKGWLARLGHVKYAMHKDNKVLRQTTLTDGTVVQEFMRCNPSWGGVSVFDSCRGIHQVITEKVLDTLVKKKGCSVFYTHLGKVHSEQQPFNNETRAAFELLASYQANKKTLVTTTRRLLGYCRTVTDLNYEMKQHNGISQIHVTTAFSGEDLQGLTWYIDKSYGAELWLNGKFHQALINNPADETGKPSVSVVWQPLNFPDISD